MASRLFEDVQVGGDGSIIVTDEKPWSAEIRLMFKQSKTVKCVEFLGTLLTKYGAGVNDSCGLHVHVDCRHRDPKRLYKKLIKALPYMQKLVRPERLTNPHGHWCKLNGPESTPRHDGVQGFDRYMAVNYMSYREHKTIEIRLHHGTVDPQEIIAWIHFILRVVKSPVPDRSSPESQRVIQQYQIPPQLHQMLKEKRKKYETVRSSSVPVQRPQ